MSFIFINLDSPKTLVVVFKLKIEYADKIEREVEITNYETEPFHGWPGVFKTLKIKL